MRTAGIAFRPVFLASSSARHGFTAILEREEVAVSHFWCVGGLYDEEPSPQVHDEWHEQLAKEA